MTNTKSNWCHLLVYSCPQYVLQLLFSDTNKLFNKIWRTRNANMTNCNSELRNSKCWKLQQNQSCDYYLTWLKEDLDLETLTKFVVYKLYYNFY